MDIINIQFALNKSIIGKSREKPGRGKNSRKNSIGQTSITFSNISCSHKCHTITISLFGIYLLQEEDS